jgi:hypothetical protein
MRESLLHIRGEEYLGKLMIQTVFKLTCTYWFITVKSSYCSRSWFEGLKSDERVDLANKSGEDGY